jgi:hypothetical protein
LALSQHAPSEEYALEGRISAGCGTKQSLLHRYNLLPRLTDSLREYYRATGGAHAKVRMVRRLLLATCGTNAYATASAESFSFRGRLGSAKYNASVNPLDP